jgi:acyl-coenzyme A synthetase/AMP-(fatty) acid ligase
MAGSVTITPKLHESIKKMVWVWTSDGSGDVSGTDTGIINGTPLRFVTNPSATAPSANYDIVINDEDGVDIAVGELANRHTSNSEQVLTGGDAKDGAAFNGPLSLVVSNAGSAKIGRLVMYYKEG